MPRKRNTAASAQDIADAALVEHQAKVAAERQPGRGRPLLLTRSVIERVEELAKQGQWRTTIAKLIRVGDSTFKEWVKKGREEREEVEKAQAAGVEVETWDTIYMDFLDALEHGEAKAEAMAIGMIQTHSLADWKAAAFFLSIKDRDRFGKQITHKGDEQHPVVVKTIAGAGTPTRKKQEEE